MDRDEIEEKRGQYPALLTEEFKITFNDYFTTNTGNKDYQRIE